jgi:hypothetical protein
MNQWQSKVKVPDSMQAIGRRIIKKYEPDQTKNGEIYIYFFLRK